MIFKTKDSLEDQIQALELALQESSAGQDRQRCERELALLRAGLKGEQEAAYHIDFHLKDNQNWAVIHDLRVECNGRVAQVDHLLIDRFLEIYVVESKSFRTKIRHAHGGWERLNFNHWEGIPCPMEQNQRHIMVLEESIEKVKLAPTRLGVVLRPRFFNVVVVQPSCSIMGELPNDARIYRMDKLVGKVRGADASTLDLWKVVSPDTLHGFAVGLVNYHKPAPKRVAAQRKTTAAPALHNDNEAAQKCQGCKGPLRTAEENYCRKNGSRFANRLLCRKCQSFAPKQKENSVEKATTLNAGESEIAARCANCGSGVDKKVVVFCRFNTKRFAGPRPVPDLPAFIQNLRTYCM
jgi:nuclease-like protein